MAKEKTAEEVAAVKAAKAAQPLPKMENPTVSLLPPLREPIAKRGRETEESFSTRSNMLWLDFLKKEKRVPQDLVLDFTVVRGAGLREKLAERETEIEELKKQVAELVASAKK